MLVHIGVAKTGKWAVGESGDSVEVVERRQGGVTAILADGQGSGPAAKRISSLVVSKAMALTAEGARDGAVARAVHDFLYAWRDGKVSAALCMLSVDLTSRTLLVTRNGDALVVVKTAGRLDIPGEVAPIGLYPGTRPWISEYALEPGIMALAASDGISNAGLRRGCQLTSEEIAGLLVSHGPEAATGLADRLLELALSRDDGRPADDMTVVVVGIGAGDPDPQVRRMSVTFPV
ncbi:MAG: PP2C family protein-serine/threonine phosphatase [Bacillota bacterium]